MSDDVKRALGTGAKCCGEDCGLCSDSIKSDPAPPLAAKAVTPKPADE